VAFCSTALSSGNDHKVQYLCNMGLYFPVMIKSQLNIRILSSQFHVLFWSLARNGINIILKNDAGLAFISCTEIKSH